MLKNINIDLLYQPPLMQPPITPTELQQKAVAGDAATVNHWEKIWISQFKACKEKFGSCSEKSIGKLYGKNLHKPAIVIGSGPSLQDSLPALRKNQEMKEPLLTISCLHNYGYFKDEGIKIDYYLTLDAGPIVLDDIGEGRQKTLAQYMEDSTDDNLLAFVATHPKMWDIWKGNIHLFNSMIPDPRVMNEFKNIENFTHYISSGGNALGACMYVAKAIMGSTKIIYVGADFCFSYDNRFHSYSTHYDNLGGYVLWPDVYGIPRKTWQSYLNFKFWFDKVSLIVPGDWVSASGGTLGAYQGGNLMSFKYMPLEDVLLPYRNATTVKVVDTKLGEFGQMVPSGESPMDLEEFFGNPNYPKDLIFF